MLLENITLERLKELSYKDLEILSQELREYIIKIVENTGGHLASSLGVVELTIALLKVFNPPQDAIVWDVGHQSYSYKILTDRKDKFPTLRQFGGISGFPNIFESPYDAFGTGHASTSISAALGIKVGRRLSNKKGHVIAIIGDGALTGGLAYEGLNNAGYLKENLLVILNDNKMSIDKNVGAISNYLNRILTDEYLRKLKRKLENLTAKFFGKEFVKKIKKIEDFAFKGLISPGMFFEELGFKYFGPIDGHNLKNLAEILKRLKKIEGPKLLHVYTTKGKGFKDAENLPEKYHGVSPKIYLPIKKKVSSWTSFFSKYICELGEKFKNIVAITAAMPSGTGLKSFAEKFKDRYFDVGIAEQHAVVFAAGLAREGLKPVVAIYSTFLQRAYDQLIHDVALQKLPVIFVLDRAGIVGEDGPTHHGIFDLSYLRHIPNFVVATPKDENELKHLLYSAILSDKPFAIRYPRGEAVGVKIDKDYKKIDIGSWEIEKVYGSGDFHLLILATGYFVHRLKEVCEKLSKKHNIKITLVNARFIKPLDEKLLKNLAKGANKIVTVEENTILGGFGSGILEFINKENIYKPLLQIGIEDFFPPHGPQEIVRDYCGLSNSKIFEKIEDFLLKNTYNFASS